MTTTIYSLIDPRTGEVRYVGKTSRALATRVNDHLARARVPRRRTYKTNWLGQLLAEGLVPIVRVLETVEGAAWPDRERFWIAYYREYGNLTNASDGGEGTPGSPRSGWRHTPEARAKISAAARGRLVPPEVRAASARRLAVFVRSPEGRARISATNKGRKHSPEARARMSEAGKRRWRRERLANSIVTP